MADMRDDYYEFIEKQYCLKGECTNKIYRIGDIVKVLLAKANAEARQIDFILVSD
jgi:ribonuclease R